MVCCMIGISLRSSSCEGIYRCSISHDCNGLFFMYKICRYGEIFAREGIFDIFLEMHIFSLLGLVIHLLLLYMEFVVVCI